MLKHRLITAAIAIPLVLAAIFWLPMVYFSAAVGLLILIGAREWTQFLSTPDAALNQYLRIAYVVVLGGVMYLSLFVTVKIVMIAAIAFWFLALISMGNFAKQKIDWLQRSAVVRAVAGIFVLVPCFVAILTIRNAMGASWLLLSFAIIWVADSAAYFAGRAFGKHALASNISPKKTWEGVVGGLIAVAIVGLLAAWYFEMPKELWIGFMLTMIVAGCMSVAGDLFESMLKRQAGIKDSGSILPGHGGILDRIDAMTAGLPVILLGFLLLRLL